MLSGLQLTTIHTLTRISIPTLQMGIKNPNLIPSMFLPNKHIWLWPSCNTHPKTLSFRATCGGGRVFLKELPVEPPETLVGSCFTNSSESPSISTESNIIVDQMLGDSAVETIVRVATSHKRLFFEPDHSTSCSILESSTQGSGRRCSSSETGGNLSYKESVAIVVETENAYADFKKSMEEMVEIHGLKDWDCLEELLGWYLRMNEKDNHEFIVGAFFDLLTGINSGGSCDGGDGGGGVDHSTASLNSVASNFSSPVSSPDS